MSKQKADFGKPCRKNKIKAVKLLLMFSRLGVGYVLHSWKQTGIEDKWLAHRSYLKQLVTFQKYQVNYEDWVLV